MLKGVLAGLALALMTTFGAGAAQDSSFPFKVFWVAPLGNSNWIVPTVEGPAVSLDPNRNGYYGEVLHHGQQDC